MIELRIRFLSLKILTQGFHLLGDNGQTEDQVSILKDFNAKFSPAR